jgi:hypothetical protein
VRVEFDIGEAGGAQWGEGLPSFIPARRRRRVDRFDLAVLGAFALASLWILAVDLWQVVAHGRVWTGTDGVYIVDQMQYLAWIRDASHHFLSSNLFVVQPTVADYFQPAVTISAGLTALGVAPWLSLLVWKPVAVVCAFFAVRAYIRANLTGRWPRRAALVLGLFFGSFSVVYGDFSVVGDLFMDFLSWGYTFGLLAVGLLVLALLAYDRTRRTGGTMWLAGVLGAGAALLHPWQGELLIVILAGAEVAMWRATGRRPRGLRTAFLTIGLTALPLLYYWILGRADPSWSFARVASKHGFSIWSIALGLAPLLVPAVLGYRGPTKTFLTAVTRTWPAAALLVWALSASQVGATPLHAFDGIAIPLSVLAVQGVCHMRFAGRMPRAGLAGALAVALVTIPANVFLMHQVATLVAPASGNPNFINADEHAALRYLAHSPQSGAVVTRFYLGTVVPAYTGRSTYVGDCLWSQPECLARAYQIQVLFNGTMPRTAAVSFVRSTGARFLLADCTAPPNLTQTLAPLTVSLKRFGCAGVYELDAPGPPMYPLTDGRGYAPVRASRGQ